MERSKELICYSISVPPETEAAERLLWQLEASLISLRECENDRRVQVVLYGEPTNDVLSLVAEHRVELVGHAALAQHLACAYGAEYAPLASYHPTHKWMTIFNLEDWESVLFVDCDTYFLGSPSTLFSAHHADVSAREEPFTNRSHLATNIKHVDEHRLAQLAKSLGAKPVAPFNTGVVCLRNAIWKRLRDYELTYLNLLRAFRGFDERFDPSDYPSQNNWIAEQVAAWLTVGQLHDATLHYFDRSQLLQGGEFSVSPLEDTNATLCHYFSSLTAHFDAWLSGELQVRL